MKRKIERFLLEWKNRTDRPPLVIKGARQIGKTYSIRKFAKSNYKNFIEINFAEDEHFKNIFDDGFEINNIIRNITFVKPESHFTDNTLIFFDEVQLCPKAMAALKFFKLDNRFDVICSGSLMGINYNEIALNSVGYKEDYEMYSMDFEEFLWAKGFDDSKISLLRESMIKTKPLNDIQFKTFSDAFFEYIIVGGMPSIVKTYMINHNFEGILKRQKQLLKDYEEDITKYAKGLEKGKILNVFRNISFFLGKENKRYQISKIQSNARNREYIGAFEWLSNAGIINMCYCLNTPSLPLKGNYDISKYKVYFADSGLLIGSLDEEAQNDLRINRNLNTFKGAIFESIAAEAFVKSGKELYYYLDQRSSMEIDFFARTTDLLIPIEIKASDGATRSLKRIINQDKYEDVKIGIKFANKNIGFNGEFYTFPYFTMFLLKDFLKNLK